MHRYLIPQHLPGAERLIRQGFANEQLGKRQLLTHGDCEGPVAVGVGLQADVNESSLGSLYFLDLVCFIVVATCWKIAFVHRQVAVERCRLVQEHIELLPTLHRYLIPKNIACLDRLIGQWHTGCQLWETELRPRGGCQREYST